MVVGEWWWESGGGMVGMGWWSWESGRGMVVVGGWGARKVGGWMEKIEERVKKKCIRCVIE